jgi:cell wall-associated NlpC family hydrolase
MQTNRRVISRNVANLYARPSTSSEVVSQALLGEVVQVQDSKVTDEGKFFLVDTADCYSGWVRALALNDGSQHLGLITGYRTVATLFADVHVAPNSGSELLARLSIGSQVGVLAKREGIFQRVRLADGTEGYIGRYSLAVTFDYHALRATEWTLPGMREGMINRVGEMAVKTGMRLIGTPYLWGGKSAFGIDCSGLTQLCYRSAGIELLRDASLQFRDPRFAAVEEGLPLWKAAFREGDLLFFGRGSKITHVGMATGDRRVLHSGGGIGVVCQGERPFTYTPQYIGARRLSTEASTLALRRLA